MSIVETIEIKEERKYGYLVFQKPIFRDTEYNFYPDKFYLSIEEAKKRADDLRYVDFQIKEDYDESNYKFGEILWEDDIDGEFYEGHYLTWLYPSDENDPPELVIGHLKIQRIEIGKA